GSGGDIVEELLPSPFSPEGGGEVAQLTSLRLAGWKSIRDAKIELRPLNVRIGANGAGKSNLVSFFKLMNEMMGGAGSEQDADANQHRVRPTEYNCQRR